MPDPFVSAPAAKIIPAEARVAETTPANNLMFIVKLHLVEKLIGVYQTTAFFPIITSSHYFFSVNLLQMYHSLYFFLNRRKPLDEAKSDFLKKI